MEENSSGNPIWLLLSVPVFFLTWYLIGMIYAFIFGIGSLAVLYVIFVWLPADQAMKLSRRQNFDLVNQKTDEVAKLLSRVKDRKISAEVGKALQMAGALAGNYARQGTHQGLTEEQLLPMLSSIEKMLTDWIGHESGDFPLSAKEAVRIKGNLSSADDLFASYQQGGLDKSDSMTAQFQFENQLAAQGIEKKEVGDE